jgi:hypothetical protein
VGGEGERGRPSPNNWEKGRERKEKRKRQEGRREEKRKLGRKRGRERDVDVTQWQSICPACARP